jgi:MFS family permease
MAGAFHLPAADGDAARDARREKYMQRTRAEASYLFKYLILAQVIIYLEAGAIPCLLDQLSVDLNMNATQQGALGGVVYFALSAASPLCAYLLQRYNPQHVLGASLICNNLATGLLAVLPTNHAYSANLMIVGRALIGFTQAFPCIYTPLWVDEYAPREKVAGWMSYLQGSVPMGVMLGYFAGTVSNWFVPESFHLFQTWRWPFLVQFVAMCPLMFAVYFVPRKHLVIRSESARSGHRVPSVGSNSHESSSIGSRTGPPSEENQSIETVDDILEAAAAAAAMETFEDSESDEAAGTESMPLIPVTAVPMEELHKIKRGNSRTMSGLTDPLNRSFLNYIEETVKLGTAPPLSWSGPHHEQEDVMLASASMFGGSTQRGIRQLHHNQQLSQLENESSVLRRSFRSSATEGSPEIKRTSLSTFHGDHVIPAHENGNLTITTPLEMSVTMIPSYPQMRSTSGYGALDSAVSQAPSKSPTRSYLDASIYEDDLYDTCEEQGSFSDGLRALAAIPTYCFIVCGLTAVYFVVTGVQYWSTIFMIKSLHASKYLVNGLFVLVAGTGPVFGVFFGGWLIDRYGGYIGVEQRAQSLGICMVLGVTAFLIAAATTFFDDIYITAAFLWLLLFFGGSILPACTGIFISVVPAQHRALASSFSVMVFNLVGYALSPYLTGLVMEWVLSQQGKPDTYFAYCDEACAYRVGFRFCLFWSVWSFVCIGAAWLFARKEAADKRRDELAFYEALKPLTVDALA